jgi:hypothetical protein
MKRRLYAPAVLLIGLLSAQIVATAQVYLSNLHLLQATELIARSGYLAVPNLAVAGRLASLKTAVAGGLFFTLSIGAGLSLATLAAVWLWDRFFRRRLKTAFLYLLMWIGLLALVNADGLNPVATTYCFIVPLVTGIAALQLLPPRTPLLDPAGIFWPVSAAVIMALLWGLVMDRHMFTNIRDHLLLGNRIGRSITQVYYAFTLFPAEAFKSLEQKQLRTSVLGDSLSRPERARLEPILRNRDYLPVPVGYPADLIIENDKAGRQFTLAHRDRIVSRVPPAKLFADSDNVLVGFSRRLDNNQMFRRLTLTGLLFGFPLVLFTFLFSLLGCLPNLFLTVHQSNVITAAVCILVGVLLLLPVYRGHTAVAGVSDPEVALAAASANNRIAALKQACREKRDATPGAMRARLAASPHVGERYWLARSLAFAKDPAARNLLLKLADDPAPIVACQALWAMGRRNSREMIPEIIQRISTSSHWYIQMYGYRALRTLGWVQPRSPQLSY